MATNTIFKHNDPSSTEHNLVNDLVVESIQVAGFDVQYLPRTSNNVDTLFEDAETSSFSDAYTVEMYFGENSMTGFGGEGDLITRFGYEVRDSVQLVIAVSRFDAVIGTPATLTRPREGDLIYFPFSKQLYEITFVEDQVPFFQLGKNFIYQLECSLFQYADEEMDTGISAIDSIESSLTYQINLTLSSISGSFTVGTNVYQGEGIGTETAKAEVVSWNSPILRVMNIQGAFATATVVQDYDVGNYGTVDSIADQNTTTSQSSEIETLADSGIVDFTESNPFGDF